ncbi:MAG: T9SS type A sorting domain-containing protein [Bacteroidota bacterium]
MFPLSFSAQAQPVVWEKLPFLYDDGGGPVDSAEFIGFVAGGDTLFAAGNDGHYLFHAEADGGTGTWEQLCPSNCTTEDGLVTRAGTLIVASSLTGVGCDRSLNYGRTWQQNVAPQQRDCHAIHQSALPAYGGPDRGRIIGAQVSAPCFSDEDGAPGTWTCGPSSGGGTGGDTVAFGDVMPSAALPEGRLLAGVWNGITTSDDGGRTWQPSSLYGFARAITRSLTWVPEAGHPYGGAALAAVQDLGLGERDSLATIWRSDDGGSTWTSVHRFSPTEYGIPDQGDNGEGYPLGYRLNQAVLFTASDGVVWAGLYANVAGPDPANGSMARSFDGGRTWEVAAGPGSGWGGRGVRQIIEARDGRIYVAAEEGGVWRTVNPVVAVANAPEAPEPVRLGVRVEPNPVSGRAVVQWQQTEAGTARVTVHDARGREVLVAAERRLGAGDQSTEVDTSGLAPGVYLVRVVTEAGTASARLTVAR